MKIKCDSICEEYSATCKLFKTSSHMLLGDADKRLERWDTCGNAIPRLPLKEFAANLLYTPTITNAISIANEL